MSKGILMEALQDLRQVMARFDRRAVKKMINTELADDRDSLIEQFHLEFDHMQTNDEVRLEALILLAELGIEVPREDLSS